MSKYDDQRAAETQREAAEADEVIIYLGLPLPIDVFNGLGMAIDAMWPGSVYIDNKEVRRPGTTAIKIKRGKPAVDPDSFDEVDRDAENPSSIYAFTSGGVGMTHGGEVVKRLGAMLMAYLAEHPDAINYVEQQLIWPDEDGDGETVLTVVVMKPEGKTPHELRLEAERDRDRARLRVETLEFELGRAVEAASDPIGLAEMIELAGVKRGTVDSWRTRGVLPKPRWTVGGRPAWSRAEIERWLADRDSLAERSTDSATDSPSPGS